MDKNLESNEYPTLFSGESWAYKYPQWKSYRAELFKTSFHEILVRETNLYTQQKAAVKPDQNESRIIFIFDFRVLGSRMKEDNMMNSRAQKL